MYLVDVYPSTKVTSLWQLTVPTNRRHSPCKPALGEIAVTHSKTYIFANSGAVRPPCKRSQAPCNGLPKKQEGRFWLHLSSNAEAGRFFQNEPNFETRQRVLRAFDAERSDQMRCSVKLGDRKNLASGRGCVCIGGIC
jgi:hypothetical protein